ncbi:helix-turn-helix transcriptional regulator [Paenibacillus mesophilus]|nr:helix-turn-helix transcriptional regulator [Paenibacillus mesophilus]TMV42898.1 helix-turn-helix transcriptional regulator [Paenibacillus mesophilus]
MPDPTASNIGLNIKKLRLNKQWTQQELGEHLNISPQAVSKWENGSAALT